MLIRARRPTPRVVIPRQIPRRRRRADRLDAELQFRALRRLLHREAKAGLHDALAAHRSAALELRLSRSGATVEARPFLVEPVDAICEEHVQVDVETRRRAESLDEGDSAGAGTGAHALPGAAYEECGDRPVDDAQDLGRHRGAGREQEP